jgi:tetratricopeptide (TPR) repeat protein
MNEWDEQDWKRFEDALRDRDPWELASELELPPPDAGPLRALAARLDEERTNAQKLLAPLLTSQAAFEGAGVEDLLGTPSSVAVLTSAAIELYARQPSFALAVATAAVNLGARLAAADELPAPATLGLARVERGKVLFLIGRYREAEEELGLADEAFDRDVFATDWERARAALVRANVYVETHRFDAAIAEARRAARAFRAFGDTSRFLAARLVEGGVFLLQRDFRMAAGVLDGLAEEARSLGDRLHLARALQTAGNCYIELGEHEQAERHFREALALWDELRLPVERVRTNWSIGVLHRSMGDLDEAIDRIDDARRGFEALGIVNDAAIARLELAEVLLLAERASDVPDLLRDVVVSFTNEGLMQNAKIALAYLRESVEAGAIEARMVRHVRDYLEHPESAFLPL